MAKSATVRLQGSIEAMPGGRFVIDDVFTNAAAAGEVRELTLNTGNNTITVPDLAAGFILKPKANNTTPITLKGANGDAGIPLHDTQPSLVSLDPAVISSLVLNVGLGPLAIDVIWL